MAGYMSKLMNYVFEGEAKAAAAIADGHLCTIAVSDGSLVATEVATADANTTATILEGADGNGLYRLLITKVSKVYYFVEGADANARNYAIDSYTPYGSGEECKFAAGAFVRCHPLEAGEEIMTDNIDSTATLTVGSALSLAASGKWDN